MEPITRKEKFLAAAGGQSVDLPEPITREETFLKAIAEGGGGGGSDLPDVTAADNGKILKVVGGEWTAEDNDFVVTFTISNDVWNSDKLYTEILEAITANKNIYGKVAGNAVSNDGKLSTQTLLLPLDGTNNTVSNDYSFSGAFQGSRFTLFINLVVTITPPLTQTVTLYKKEVELPEYFYTFYVAEFTVSGYPTGNVYPLSCSESYSEIMVALLLGKETFATITLDGTNLKLPAVAYGGNTIMFSGIVLFGGVVSSLIIVMRHDELTDTDSSSGYFTPLNTSTMTFDSTTNTLAITQ